MRPYVSVLLFAAGLAACKATDGDESDGQGSAIGTKGKCEVLNELTGKAMTEAELAKLDDPVAKLVLTTEGCPTTVSELTTKLREADSNGCFDQGKGKIATGVKTHLISETVALSGKPGRFRTVIGRNCDFRSSSSLLMSGNADVDGVGESFLELIAKDQTKGVFDYYEQKDGRWRFFGTSGDYVTSGYTCDTGQCTPKIASKARCAGCHPGGGLVMKEHLSPWVFWDLGSMPGAGQVVDKFPDILGERASGADLDELRIAPGNQAWVKKRLELLKPKGTAEVLRPLFCTVDMNLQTAPAIQKAEGLTTVPFDFFVDRSFTGPALPIENADYKALLASTASRLPDGSKDTPFAFVYPERSQQDLAYQAELINQNVVDDDFVRDVLAVDFTRPAYSKARCDLLALAPTLAADKLTANAIRDGFKAALAGKTGAAEIALLQNLNRPVDKDAHQSAVDAFFTECAKRPKKDFLTDVMRWASHLRRTVRATSPIIEFPETLPQDNLPDTTGAFDPKTCVLQ